MTKKVYRTAMGRAVDLGALQLQNEHVRAVGNMGVNSRGDRIDGSNKPIESRNQQVSRQYKRQTNVMDAPIVSSRSKAKSAPVESPVESTSQEIEVEQTQETSQPKSGLADAIARARQVKQEPMKTPRQLAQERAGVKKI